MRSSQSSHTFPLASVKPLNDLLAYRSHCIDRTRQALGSSSTRREVCPADRSDLKQVGSVDGLEYLRCEANGCLLLAELPTSREWATLLAAVSEYRHTPSAFHMDIMQSRSDNVFLPKLDWIQSTLRLHGITYPRIVEVGTPPSDFTGLLKRSGLFLEVQTASEMEWVIAAQSSHTGRGALDPHREPGGSMEACVLLESLDRVNDPMALLTAVSARLVRGGLMFLTAQVSSGFDIAVLGLRDRYLYPPDRTNCFSLKALESLLVHAGFALAEVSTPGVLDVEIVNAHRRQDPPVTLSDFERLILDGDQHRQEAFQQFLQENRMSSFARIVGRKVL